MRKVILATVLILPLVFQSCKDDEDEISLIGTEWVMQANPEEYIPETHLKFIDKSRGQAIYYESYNGEKYTDTEDFTYTLSGSTVTITFESEGDDPIILSGTIKSDLLTIVEDGIQYVFTKQ